MKFNFRYALLAGNKCCTIYVTLSENWLASVVDCARQTWYLKKIVLENHFENHKKSFISDTVLNQIVFERTFPPIRWCKNLNNAMF